MPKYHQSKYKGKGGGERRIKKKILLVFLSICIRFEGQIRVLPCTSLYFLSLLIFFFYTCTSVYFLVLPCTSVYFLVLPCTSLYFLRVLPCTAFRPSPGLGALAVLIVAVQAEFEVARVAFIEGRQLVFGV